MAKPSLWRRITGVERDRGADAREGGDEVEERAQEHLAVGTRTDDVGRIAEHGAVQEDGRDREDEGHQVQHARRRARASSGVRRDSILGVVRMALVMSVSFFALVGSIGLRGETVARLGSGSTRITETSGRPTSRTFWSKPCSAAWSATWPWMTRGAVALDG